MDILTAVINPDTITEEEIIRLGTEAAIILDSWSNEKLRAAMAYLNSLLYCVSVSQGALVVNKASEEAKRWFNNGIEKLKGMVNMLVMPITYTSAYIKKFWGDSTASGSSIRRIRDDLADEFGLFEFDKHKPGERNRRATYRNIDIPKMLLVYEQMEKTWIARNGFDTLPDHKGGFCKMLYDAVFKRSQGMNRQYNGMPLTEAEAATMRVERRMATQLRHEDELRALRESEYEFRKQYMNVTHPDIWQRLMTRIRYLQEWCDRQRSEPIPELPY